MSETAQQEPKNNRIYKLSKEAILHAIESIDREGQALTLERVRNYLGGGSFTTINPILKKWKSDREIHRTHAVDMPTELRLIMERMGAQMWTSANAEAAAKVRAAEALLHDKEADYIAERQAYETENKRLEELSATQQKELIAIREQLKEYQEQHITLSSQNARLEERVKFLHDARETGKEDLKKQAELAKDLQAEVDILEKQVARSGGENKALKESVIHTESEARTIRRKADKLVEDLAAVKEEKRTAEHERDQARKDVEELTSELARSKKTLVEKSKALTKANREHQKSLDELAAANGRAIDLQEQLTTCETSLKQRDLLDDK